MAPVQRTGRFGDPGLAGSRVQDRWFLLHAHPGPGGLGGIRRGPRCLGPGELEPVLWRRSLRLRAAARERVDARVRDLSAADVLAYNRPGVVRAARSPVTTGSVARPNGVPLAGRGSSALRRDRRVEHRANLRQE